MSDTEKKAELVVTLGKARTPFRQWVYERLLAFAQRALSDDPYSRADGQKRLREVAALISRKEAERLFRTECNRVNAAKPRKKRGLSSKTKLIRRGLGVVLMKYKDITAEGLCNILEAEGRITWDDRGVDIEIQNAGDSIRIRDLRERAKLQSATVKKASLRQYLKDAKSP